MSRTLLLFPLLALTGCGLVVGSGRLVTEDRPAPGFVRLDISDSFDVTVVPGAPGVTITADDNLLPLVETVVRDGTLFIGTKPDWMADVGTLRATVSTPAFEGARLSGASHVRGAVTGNGTWNLTVSGASHAELTGFNVAFLDVEASGASWVDVQGAADRLDADLSGASGLRADRLDAREVSVEVSGASSGTVRASGSVRGEVTGASSLRILGNPPVVAVDSSGASTVY